MPTSTSSPWVSKIRAFALLDFSLHALLAAQLEQIRAEKDSPTPKPMPQNNTAQKVQGRFYFKLTESGNLLGEYSNQFLVRNEPECSSRVEGQTNTFYGVFISTWWESNDAVARRLEISPKAAIPNQPQPAGLCSLRWLKSPNDSKSKEEFVGEAMLSDGMLIGNYWSVT